MFRRVRPLLLSTVFVSLATASAFAQQAPACGGDLAAFLAGVKSEAVAKGIPADVVDRALAGAKIDEKVLSRDRGEVQIVCLDGSTVRGVPVVVGRDYVEVREYAEGRPVGRTPDVVPFTAVAAVGCPA